MRKKNANGLCFSFWLVGVFGFFEVSGKSSHAFLFPGFVILLPPRLTGVFRLPLCTSTASESRFGRIVFLSLQRLRSCRLGAVAASNKAIYASRARRVNFSILVLISIRRTTISFLYPVVPLGYAYSGTTYFTFFG